MSSDHWEYVSPKKLEESTTCFFYNHLNILGLANSKVVYLSLQQTCGMFKHLKTDICYRTQFLRIRTLALAVSWVAFALWGRVAGFLGSWGAEEATSQPTLAIGGRSLFLAVSWQRL